MTAKQQKQNNEEEEDKERWRQVGVYMTIPFMLAVAPIVGWLFGHWLDKKFSTSPYFMYIFVAIGFGAGVREVYRILKRFGNGE